MSPVYKSWKRIVKATILNKRVMENKTDNLLSHLQQSILCTNYILKQHWNQYKCLLFPIILIIYLKPIY